MSGWETYRIGGTTFEPSGQNYFPSGQPCSSLSTYKSPCSTRPCIPYPGAPGLPAPCGSNNTPGCTGPVRFFGNTGSAIADSACRINIIGTGGIFVTGSGNTLTIDYAFTLSTFIVGPVGSAAPYTNLCAAITAANLSTLSPVTIFLLPGATYTLCDELSNTKKINFVAFGGGTSPQVVVTGSAISYGNKTWFGVNFVGPGTYELKDTSIPVVTIDEFNNCLISSNFLFKVTFDKLLFNNCIFESTIDTDSIIEVGPGSGSLILRNSIITFTRLGSATATSFIRLRSNLSTTNTVIEGSQFTGSIDNLALKFAMIDIEGSQRIIFQSNIVDIIASAAPNSGIFGTITPLIVSQANLIISNSTFLGSGNIGLTLLLDLKSSIESSPLTVASSIIFGMRLYNNSSPLITSSNWLLFSHLTCHPSAANFASFSSVNSSIHITCFSVMVKMMFPFSVFSFTGAIIPNFATVILSASIFNNTVAAVPWLTSNVPTTNVVTSSNSTRIGFIVAVGAVIVAEAAL